MAYKIVISPEAEKEIDHAFEYYAEFSKSAGKSFKKQLLDSYKKLRLNPFYERRYLNVRVLPFPKYPYIILFRIDELKKTVYILSVFCTHQDPEKYP
ncbi:type II toxin-antitoxin system RelE/ParE family toxin [Chryseobacterium sp. SC28]|uniref:type II toxin-antitoxin system RelE/ParE family toxin n=1 Tax=Chryseobacterium sp. SC28 TaxID=2268028 RepID=UPI000F645AEE|nr:type II toxin-antitoxin system RelE/ParE family toxin [Chryseobacterium sp. SC28]RRQ46906.1 type II toxin-antitoxin system RelE/ParE family toxin [Chryseobacterium sp. SC28]